MSVSLSFLTCKIKSYLHHRKYEKSGIKKYICVWHEIGIQKTVVPFSLSLLKSYVSHYWSNIMADLSSGKTHWRATAEPDQVVVWMNEPSAVEPTLVKSDVWAWTSGGENEVMPSTQNQTFRIKCGFCFCSSFFISSSYAAWKPLRTQASV